MRETVKKLDLSMRKQPKQVRSQHMVDCLLDATARVLVSDGYDAITTNRIAQVAGVGIGSLYEYFPNKESLVAAVITQHAETIIDEVNQSMKKSLTLSEDKALRFWIKAMIKALNSRKTFLRVAIIEVPFLQELPITSQIPRLLIGISEYARSNTEQPITLNHSGAAIFHLTSMVGAAVLNTALFPPKHISTDTLTEELAILIQRMLFSA